MRHTKLVAVAAGVSLAAAGTGAVALASGTAHSAAAPAKTTIKEKAGLVMKPNRFIQDKLRWDKDVYRVRSGGTLHVVSNEVDEGPHTFSVVKKSDLPRNAAEMNRCKVCESLGEAHGADPNSDAPPKFQFLENGTGSESSPNVDRAGDSGVTGPGKKNEFIDLKVTAKKGSTLNFMCLIHPWMQAKVKVG
jgi:hypothetical protein